MLSTLIPADAKPAEVAALLARDEAEQRALEVCEKGEKERAGSPVSVPLTRKVAQLLALL